MGLHEILFNAVALIAKLYLNGHMVMVRHHPPVRSSRCSLTANREIYRFSDVKWYEVGGSAPEAARRRSQCRKTSRAYPWKLPIESVSQTSSEIDVTVLCNEANLEGYDGEMLSERIERRALEIWT